MDAFELVVILKVVCLVLITIVAVPQWSRFTKRVCQLHKRVSALEENIQAQAPMIHVVLHTDRWPVDPNEYLERGQSNASR